MSDVKAQENQQKLMGRGSVTVISGILTLAAYWAWIFSIFSSTVLNPFGPDRIDDYLFLNVVFAGVSALAMLVAALLAKWLDNMLMKKGLLIVLVIASSCVCIPAIVHNLGINVTMLQALIPWIISAASSSLIYLNTSAFFIWLKRTKLSRCIALSFLFAAFLYLIVQFMTPLAASVTVMLFPVLSCLFSAVTNRYILKNPLSRNSKAAVPSQRNEGFIYRMSELIGFIPSTMLYSVSFGLVSYIVLLLASRNDLIFVIALSIMVSAIVLFAYSFKNPGQIDGERFRKLLLPLIAVALLPFPYLNEPLKILFLAFAVFGFTGFDTVVWGDLADEVRERDLSPCGYMGAAAFVDFTGVFIGWASGCALFAITGEGLLDTGFGIFSIVLVILLIVMLIFDNPNSVENDSKAAFATEFRDKWKETCQQVAQEYGLSNQEERIFIMLARGRSQKSIADELFISTHTVKTHVYHIYRKIDVHSQQELINSVEERLLVDNNGARSKTTQDYSAE